MRRVAALFFRHDGVFQIVAGNADLLGPVTAVHGDRIFKCGFHNREPLLHLVESVRFGKADRPALGVFQQILVVLAYLPAEALHGHFAVQNLLHLRGLLQRFTGRPDHGQQVLFVDIHIVPL
ncbi:hypothetical protein SDC9_178535 [bioreactor metagenome]|uniref:Uncharacterized protein n=1 Tax=bioreactor metagenome TaxID=1076179 RepID=A0A645GYD8_9ZZZZ